MNKIIKDLVCINMDNKDYCELSDLTSDWKNVLSNYMSTRYIKCIKFDVHRHYYIAINTVDDDTLDILNKVGIVIDSIDYIVNCIKIKFKDESSRDLVFNVLNVWQCSMIDYEDIYDNLDDYEYPYNHVNKNDLQV